MECSSRELWQNQFCVRLPEIPHFFCESYRPRIEMSSNRHFCAPIRFQMWSDIVGNKFRNDATRLFVGASRTRDIMFESLIV